MPPPVGRRRQVQTDYVSGPRGNSWVSRREKRLWPEHETGGRVRAPKAKPRALGALPQAGRRGKLAETRTAPPAPLSLSAHVPERLDLWKDHHPQPPPGGRGGSSGSCSRRSDKATASYWRRTWPHSCWSGITSGFEDQFAELSYEVLNMLRTPWKPLQTDALRINCGALNSPQGPSPTHRFCGRGPKN